MLGTEPGSILCNTSALTNVLSLQTKGSSLKIYVQVIRVEGRGMRFWLGFLFVLLSRC